MALTTAGARPALHDLSCVQKWIWLRREFEKIRANVTDVPSKPAYDTLERVLAGDFLPCGQRSTNQVYWEHILLRYIGNVPLDIERNYSPALQLSITGSVGRLLHGHAGIAESARLLDERLATTHYTMLDTFMRDTGLSGGWVSERWAYLDSELRCNQVRDGIDAFLIREGRIEVQMIHYTVEPAQAASRFCRQLGIAER